MVYLYAIGIAILFGVLVTLARREETRTGWPQGVRIWIFAYFLAISGTQWGMKIIEGLKTRVK